MTAHLTGTGQWEPTPKHPRATLALVLGIISATGLVVGVTLVLGPLAWYLGASSVRSIDRAPGAWTGRGAARAGQVTGLIATCALVLGLVLLALITAITIAVSTIDVGYGA